MLSSIVQSGELVDDSPSLLSHSSTRNLRTKLLDLRIQTFILSVLTGPWIPDIGDLVQVDSCFSSVHSKIPHHSTLLFAGFSFDTSSSDDLYSHIRTVSVLSPKSKNGDFSHSFPSFNAHLSPGTSSESLIRLSFLESYSVVPAAVKWAPLSFSQSPVHAESLRSGKPSFESTSKVECNLYTSPIVKRDVSFSSSRSLSLPSQDHGNFAGKFALSVVGEKLRISVQHALHESTDYLSPMRHVGFCYSLSFFLSFFFSFLLFLSAFLLKREVL